MTLAYSPSVHTIRGWCWWRGALAALSNFNYMKRKLISTNCISFFKEDYLMHCLDKQVVELGRTWRGEILTDIKYFVILSLINPDRNIRILNRNKNDQELLYRMISHLLNE